MRYKDWVYGNLVGRFCEGGVLDLKVYLIYFVLSEDFEK